MMFGQFLKYLGLAGYPQSYASPTVLAQSAVPSSVTGTATETVLGTVVIPANAVAINGRVRLRSYWSCTANADSKTLRIRIAGATGIGSGSITSTGVAYTLVDADFINRGSGNIQYIQLAYNNGASSAGGASGGQLAIDLTQAQSLTLTGQLGTTTDTITLLGYSVEVLNP
jgi:hypothetical protein